MIVLGIETSCDETAVGIVRDGKELLANAVFSSMDLHKVYGGVVPEIAARSHIESITRVLTEALDTAFPDQSPDEQWAQIDAIAVTYGAGLGGSLLVGVMTARTLAIMKDKPLYAINHVEAHVYANFLTSAGSALPAAESNSADRKASLDDTTLPAPILSRSSTTTTSSDSRSRLVSSQSPAPVNSNILELGDTKYSLPTKQPSFPLLSLIVSGGHSQLVLFHDHFNYQLLGKTRDDAIGEAFDKVAKIIGLPYPGGPSIAEAARYGDANSYQLPKARLSERYEFSFSGLKTAVLRLAQQEIGEDFTFPSFKVAERLSEAQRHNIAASFQRVAVETVVDKTITAFEQYDPKSVVIAGGVAANKELRNQLSAHLPLPLEYTDMKLCTDNGAMVATLGCYKAMNRQETADPYTLSIEPNLSM